MTMGIFPKPTESWPTWAVWLYYAFLAVILLGLGVKTFFKSFVVIEQNHAGVKMRFGQPRRVKPYDPRRDTCSICDAKQSSECRACRKGRYCLTCPECPVHDELRIVDGGFHWVIPFTHGIKSISIEDDTVPLELCRFEFGGKQLFADGAFVYRVERKSRDLALALFKAKNLEATIKAQALKVLGEACTTPASLSDPHNPDAISELAVARFAGQESYGVKAVRYDLTPVSRTPEQVVADAMRGGNNESVGALRAVSGS